MRAWLGSLRSDGTRLLAEREGRHHRASSDRRDAAWDAAICNPRQPDLALQIASGWADEKPLSTADRHCNATFSLAPPRLAPAEARSDAEAAGPGPDQRARPHRGRRGDRRPGGSCG